MTFKINYLLPVAGVGCSTNGLCEVFSETGWVTYISTGTACLGAKNEDFYVSVLHHTHIFACVQLTEKALVIVTSRVPIAKACIPQCKLGGISAGPCEWLMLQIAPELDEEELKEAVHLCMGVPLVVRLVGNAFASGRITIQVICVSMKCPEEIIVLMHSCTSWHHTGCAFLFLLE